MDDFILIQASKTVRKTSVVPADNLSSLIFRKRVLFLSNVPVPALGC